MESSTDLDLESDTCKDEIQSYLKSNNITSPDVSDGDDYSNPGEIRH